MALQKSGFRFSIFGVVWEPTMPRSTVTMIVGLVVAWNWEGGGGLLILGGFNFFAIVNHGVRPRWSSRRSGVA